MKTTKNSNNQMNLAVIEDNGGWKIVADETGPLPAEQMGASGRDAFYTAAGVLTADQIEDALVELGETGGAKVENGGLYTQREENCDWIFCGGVDDAEIVETQIGAFFAR